MNMLLRIVAVFVITWLGACASLPVKERAVRTLDGTQRLLAQSQDLERNLCNAAAFKTAQTEPILTCEGPLSESVQLTTARHQEIARAYSKAFDAQIKAAVVLRAWRAGDPVPSTVPDIMQAVAEAAGLVKQLSPNSTVAEILNTLVQVRSEIEALAAALKGAQ